MLEMKRLRLLWELSERGTLVQVAEALNYSPSAVSQQLGLLEREVGTPLLRRVGRTLELTAAAEALVAETAELLAGLERAETAAHRVRGEVAGSVRVAVFQTAVLAIMPQALRRLRTEYPSLRVEMVQHEPETALHETSVRGFDLVVAEQYPGHATAQFAGLDHAPLTFDAIQLALPRVGAGDAEFDLVERLEDAAALPWVMEPRGAASRHWAEQACRTAGFEPDVRYETADLQAHVRLIESGNAVALLPGLVRAETRLRMIDLPGDPHRSIFTAARLSNAESPAVLAVRETLAIEAASLAKSAENTHTVEP
ncbi:LysR family transcriptional regulator [Leucobacter aridicollis]|uniref:DNA-binding transcriptional LysR family regulator n=1 Tax=Leucobacter aridicollis TaxID=283878 RepID=A0A852RH19_9MICO|nr:LysR family transcriptional regulator [Leucobacter aridicollis]MBL3680846.1 LysR family transcriptional regulator [Leucobacter aridicollis]MCS3429142.1 DNA-binding transcriptional LysR family regulator [Leucobacter aridicollis]NYD28150.1 DNA-binding transcriptional LysR family regulator [Leucobacter aridicollis]